MTNRREFMVRSLFTSLGTLLPAAAVTADPPKDKGDLRVPNEKIEKMFEQMREGKYRELKFPQLSKEDVPALLELATSTKSLKSFPRNPFSSFAQTDCPEGMIAMWLIEGYRVGNKYPSLNPLALPLSRKLGREWNSISAGLQPQVIQAYQDWWKGVRNAKEADLKSVNPLEGLTFYWY